MIKSNFNQKLAKQLKNYPENKESVKSLVHKTKKLLLEK